MPCAGESSTATSSVWHQREVVDAAINDLGNLDLGTFDGSQLRQVMHEITTPLRRLEAARSKVTGALHRLEAAATPRPHVADRTCREFLTAELGLSPAEAKDVTSTSRRLPDAPSTEHAYAGGAVTSRHASVIAASLPHIPVTARATVEAELLALAVRTDPVSLGRRARQLIAHHDAGELHTIERRRRARRRFSYSQTADGALRFSGELTGIDAEQARAAFDAFTPRPHADDRRSHDHRRADGFVTLTASALRSGDAPTQHGVRPHVLVIIEEQQMQRHARGLPAILALGSGDVVTTHDARYTLDDCDLTRIVLDANRTPIDVSTAVRTVPVGLWRALQARDQGCTWPDCTAPTSWCDVAHLERPFALGGRLGPTAAALLCRRHHRRFDAGGWRAEVAGDRVAYHPDPNRPSVARMLASRRPGATAVPRHDARPPPSVEHGQPPQARARAVSEQGVP